MSILKRSVGYGAKNELNDVTIVQTLLRRHKAWLDVPPPEKTGKFDSATGAAIKSFQINAAALLTADGLVSPNSFTAQQLIRPEIPQLQHRVFLPACWFHSSELTKTDFDAAAQTLGCESAAIQAVASVETLGRAWEAVGRPIILFERHLFSRLTHGAFDRTHPDISNPTQGGYGITSAQYTKLRRAAVLDEQAAWKAASWGSFQILGINHAVAGFDTVDGFVSAMLKDEKHHLDAFIAFIRADAGMLKALQDRDWAVFARRYNGPAYSANSYDTKMADAYVRLAKRKP